MGRSESFQLKNFDLLSYFKVHEFSLNENFQLKIFNSLLPRNPYRCRLKAVTRTTFALWAQADTALLFPARGRLEHARLSTFFTSLSPTAALSEACGWAAELSQGGAKDTAVMCEMLGVRTVLGALLGVARAPDGRRRRRVPTRWRGGRAFERSSGRAACCGRRAASS